MLNIQADRDEEASTASSQTCKSLTSAQTDSSKTSKTKRQKILRVATLLFALFTALGGYSVISPFFPQQAKLVGLTETEIGFIFSFFPAVVFVMSPIYGYLVARLTTKFLCVSGCFLCGGCCILFGMLSYIKDKDMLLALALIIRAVEGNGSAMLNVAASSHIMETFPDKTGMMSSLIEMAIGLGYISGPALGSAFFAIGGYTLPFLVLGGLTLLTSLLLAVVLDKCDVTEPQAQNFLKLFLIPGISVMFLQFVVSCLVMTYLDPVLSTFIIDTFKVDSSVSGLIFASWSMSYVVVSPICGKLVDKGYIFSTMIIGLITSGVVYLFLAPSPLLGPLFGGHSHVWFIIIVCVAEGICEAAMYVPGYQAAINTAQVNGYELNVQTYGLMSGLMNSGYSLGSVTGPLLSGYLTERYSFGWATTMMTFILIGMATIQIVYVLAMKYTGKPLAVDETNRTELEETKPLLSSPQVLS